jgi:molybdate transport system permease protein
VETLEYAQAHTLSAGMLVFAFAILVMLFLLNKRFVHHHGQS